MTQKQFLSRIVTVIDFFLCGIDLNREEDLKCEHSKEYSERLYWKAMSMSPVCLPASSSWSMGFLIFATVRLRNSRWRFTGDFWGSGPWRGMATCYNITSMLDSTIESNMIIYQYGLLKSNILWNIHMNYLSMIYIYIWLLLTTMIFDISYCFPTIFLRQSPWILDSSYSWEILFLCVDSLHRLMLLISHTRSS